MSRKRPDQNLSALPRARAGGNPRRGLSRTSEVLPVGILHPATHHLLIAELEGGLQIDHPPSGVWGHRMGPAVDVLPTEVPGDCLQSITLASRASSWQLPMRFCSSIRNRLLCGRVAGSFGFIGKGRNCNVLQPNGQHPAILNVLFRAFSPNNQQAGHFSGANS